MYLWLIPLVTGVGYLALRSWQQDAALRSGELMDVREVSPEGEAELELRALASRCYRLELQFEASIETQSVQRDDTGSRGDSSAAFPFRLEVESLGEDTLGLPLYEAERDLRELFSLASSSKRSQDAREGGGSTIHYWGSVPLLEFESSTLGRMRFEFSIERGLGGIEGGASFEARLDKAWVVLKEDVRRLRVPASLLDFLAVDLQARRVVDR